MNNIIGVFFLYATLAIANFAPATGEGLPLQQLSIHTLSGTVEIKDESTLVIKDLIYDGKGPDAFFIVGTETDKPGTDKAIPVPFPPLEPNTVREYGDKSIKAVRKFEGERIELAMPTGIKTGDLKWLSLWCRKFNVNFGQVLFKTN